MPLYILDGYNLLFFLKASNFQFSQKRDLLIDFLQQKFKEKNWEGIIVFDGSHQRFETSGRAYKDPLEIIYSPKGQSADHYIAELIEIAKNPKQMIVITNDRALTKEIRSLQGQVQTCDIFLKLLMKKKRTYFIEKKHKDPPHEIKRLLQEFERRFNEENN